MRLNQMIEQSEEDAIRMRMKAIEIAAKQDDGLTSGASEIVVNAQAICDYILSGTMPQTNSVE